jgi:hypothetical protein
MTIAAKQAVRTANKAKLIYTDGNGNKNTDADNRIAIATTGTDNFPNIIMPP